MPSNFVQTYRRALRSLISFAALLCGVYFSINYISSVLNEKQEISPSLTNERRDLDNRYWSYIIPKNYGIVPQNGAEQKLIDENDVHDREGMDSIC